MSEIPAPGVGTATGDRLVMFAGMKKFFVGALMASATFVASGCLMSGGSLTNLPEEEFATMNLEIRLGRVDAAAPASGGVLSKSAAGADDQIILRDMVLRFTSNLKDTVWDTAQMLSQDVPGSGVGSGDDGSRTVRIDVKLAPLRWWNIEIKTHDVNDSVVHYGNVGPFSSKGGQTVTLAVPEINSRFSTYEARYALPDMIYPAGVPDSQRVYQKIFFSRLILKVDGDTVRDSTSFSPAVTVAGSRFITANGALQGDTGRFFFRPRGNGINDTTTHVQIYPYVKTGPRVFDISAYGYLEGDSITMAPRLLFHGSRTVAITPGEVTTEVPIVLDYTGPGSTPEPGAEPPKPGEPDWSGVSMNVVIGKTGKITQSVVVPGGVNL
jgi:hypothetical protein